MRIAGLPLHALTLTQIAHKRIKGGRLHPGHAQGADLLLVCQHADGRAAGRPGQVQQGLKAGVGADPVVLAVGTDQAAVQAYILCLGCGNKFNFRTHKIMLGNTVHFVEQSQCVQLNGIFYTFLFAFVNKRQAADNNVQLLALNAFAQLALVLFSAKMRQQIGYAEYGVTGIFAHADLHQLAVLFDDNAMHCQRHGHPLVFADTAVIMRFEVGHLMVFVYRVRF